MTPVAAVVIVLCVVVVSAVLVWTLLALKKTALRAESVLHMVEREIRPTLSQLESLLADLHDLSQGANDELRQDQGGCATGGGRVDQGLEGGRSPWAASPDSAST